MKRVIMVVLLAAACDSSEPGVGSDGLDEAELPSVIEDAQEVTTVFRLATGGIRFRARQCGEDGFIGGGGSASGSDRLAIGESARHIVWTGEYSATGPRPIGPWGAMDGIVGKTPRDIIGERPHVWGVEATRIEPRRPGEVTFVLQWEHWSADAPGAVPRIERGTTKLSAKDEHAVFLDGFRTSPDQNGCTESVLVELFAKALDEEEDDAGSAPTLLGYDLWLVATDAEGSTEISRFSGAGLAGEPFAFRHAPLRFDALATDGPVQLVLGTRGTLVGRARDDGMIDVRIDAILEHAVLAPGSTAPPATSGQNRGTKTIRMRPGQTVRADLPKPGGKHRTLRARKDAPHTAPPDGELVRELDLAEWAEGRELSLVLTVSEA